VPVDLRVPPPDRRVLGTLQRDVAYGRTTSYGDLARAAGLPVSAARAVGRALGANPVLVIVPCHRVVGSSGALTGYAAGLPVKRALLDLESAGADDGELRLL
jgi:methylated-DNA-[protein]-cysteine S-methyltransferase